MILANDRIILFFKGSRQIMTLILLADGPTFVFFGARSHGETYCHDCSLVLSLVFGVV